MKNVLSILFTISLFACTSTTETSTSKTSVDDVWYQVYENDEEGMGTPTGYINQKGDTVVPLGKYQFLFTDTVKQMAIVYTQDNRCIGINKNEEELFEVYWFDNGPDYVQDGLFRIKKGDKIGFANEAGEIIVEPKYKCTYPFENGQAQVAYECDLVKEGEHTMMKNAKWLNIDIEGNEIETKE